MGDSSTVLRCRRAGFGHLRVRLLQAAGIVDGGKAQQTAGSQGFPLERVCRIAQIFVYPIVFRIILARGTGSDVAFVPERSDRRDAGTAGDYVCGQRHCRSLIQGGVVRRLIKKGQEARVVGIGLVLSALGFVLILFSSNLLTASIYLSVFAAGNALIRPCVTSLITQKTPVGQGVASGLSSSMDSLGRISGPLLGAGIYDYSNTLPFLTGALLSVGALYLLYRFIVLDRNGTRHPPNRFNRPNKPPHRMFRSGGLFFRVRSSEEDKMQISHEIHKKTGRTPSDCWQSPIFSGPLFIYPQYFPDLQRKALK